MAIAYAVEAGHNANAVSAARKKLAEGDASATAGDFDKATQEYKTVVSMMQGGSCGGDDN